MKMDPAAEDELDSDNEGGVDLDLSTWLSQLDSSSTPSTNKQVSSSKSRCSAEVCQSSKAEEIDFDSILGQLSLLDDHFNSFGENETTLSKSIPPESPKVTEKVTEKVTDKVTAPAQNLNAAASRDTKVADDFGDINSLLMNAIFELNQLASDDVIQPSSAEVKKVTQLSSTEVKKVTQPSSAEVKKVDIPPTVEVSQRPVVPGSSIDTPHLPQPPDAKKPLAEKSQTPPGAVRTSAKSDAGNRGETVPLKSTDSSSSSSSTPQLENSCRSSGQSNAAVKNLPQVCLKVFSPDSSSVSVSVDQRTTVGRLCEMIISQKKLSDRNRIWGISEQIPDLLMQRLLEDHRLILEEIRSWPKETNNHLVFLETQNKYCMFNKSQVLDESKWNPKALDGWLHLKSEGKKAWKKWNFVLRNGEILCNVKGKGKPELSCLRRLSEVDVYRGVGWKKKFKAPSEFGFALKSPATQNKSAKDIEYVCADDGETMWKWVTAIRVAKFGFQLYRNFRHFVCLEENGSKPNAASASAANSQDSSTEKQKTRTSERISDSEEGHAVQRQEMINQCTGNGSPAESLLLPIGSRTKAQIPVTAQTARLLSNQPPSSSAAAQPPPPPPPLRPVGGRETQKTSPVNGTQEQHTNAQTTAPPRAMHQTAAEMPSSRCRPESPDLPPPPPPEMLTCPSFHRNDASRGKPGVPAPPRRDDATHLSLQRPKTKNAAQTKNFVLNLQRTIGQKCERGAEGLVQLEMPLPPPPLYSDEPSYLDLGDLPPPPAELLEELKMMKRKQPKQPKQPPPTPVKCRR